MSAKPRKAPKPTVLRDFFGYFSKTPNIFPAVTGVAVAVATGSLHGRNVDLNLFGPDDLTKDSRLGHLQDVDNQYPNFPIKNAELTSNRRDLFSTPHSSAARVLVLIKKLRP